MLGIFYAVRQPVLIWLIVPLALVGVTGGLLAAGAPFGFMALLGLAGCSPAEDTSPGSVEGVEPAALAVLPFETKGSEDYAFLGDGLAGDSPTRL